jgi:hypothetical protein
MTIRMKLQTTTMDLLLHQGMPCCCCSVAKNPNFDDAHRALCRAKWLHSLCRTT